MYSQASVKTATSDPPESSGLSAALVTERPEKGRLVIVRRGQSSREPRGSPRRDCGTASNLGSSDERLHLPEGGKRLVRNPDFVIGTTVMLANTIILFITNQLLILGGFMKCPFGNFTPYETY